MLFPDIVNGIFEGCGGFFIALSVIKLYREKIVKGVSFMHVGFFSAWGFWNLYFYPHLDQWISFWGGFLLVAVNCVWLGQIFYYNRINRRAGFAIGGLIAPPVDRISRVISPAEFSWDRGETWQSGGMADAMRDFAKTRRYRHCDK